MFNGGLSARAGGCITFGTSTFVIFAFALPWAAYAGQPLETETARLLPQGQGNIQLVFEYQTSKDGKELALPLVFEYGLTDRLELTVEPVAYTSIRPSGEAGTSGFGDTEATLTYLVLPESVVWPAFAAAGEIKIPTTHDPLIGTGKTDFRFYGILSKRLGNFDMHINLGYTFVGSPSGTSLRNVVDYAAALEYNISPNLTLVSEVIGNTSGGGSDTSTTIIPEATSAEFAGLVGAAYQANPWLSLSLGAQYDDKHAFLIRPGLTIFF